MSEPTVPFDFDAVADSIDGAELPDVDQQFWGLVGELLGDLVRWQTNTRGGLSAIGARTCALALYLRPELIEQSSLRQISKLEDAPTRAGLSRALLALERKYQLRPCANQKPQWARERFSRSARVVHRYGPQNTAKP